MKRVIVIFLLSAFFVSNLSSGVYGLSTTIASKKIIVYLKPDVTVELNSIKQTFRDSKGSIVYPIIYNGSTYLPVRATSGLMKESIEWDEASKTIFIGKTLSNPNKTVGETSTSAVLVNNIVEVDHDSLKPEMVSAYLKPDVLVMYDFTLQNFEDANGNRVYPIIYNGTTYLPVRAISELMKEPIEWDGITKTVCIGDGVETPLESEIEEKTGDELSVVAQNLKSLFEREEVLYYEATAKVTNIKEAVAFDEKQVIASAISDNYFNAQKLTVEIKSLDTTGFKEEEALAFDKTVAFAESTEYYMLVLENIAYLAAQDADYSMLADTFLYFAMDSQTKMEEARVLVQNLN